jgi:uncharacterized membrane protein YccC
LVNDVAETVASWVRTNIGLAATIMALVGTIIGGVVAATAWLASVHHLEKRVDVLRTDVNTMRSIMEDNRKVVGDVRRQLEATDAALKEGLGRVDERLKSMEKAK